MMKKLEDEYISRLNRNSINQKSLKKAIFSGKVIIIKKSIEVTKIINLVERYVNDFFNCSVSTIQNEFHYSKENHKFLTILQSRIKNCKLIKNTFTLFLKSLGLKTSETFMDLLTFRFSPSIGQKEVGILRPTKAHRDTWASNINHQINFWFPFHRVREENSIFILPRYFNVGVENNSSSWSFDKYKQIRNYSSVPISSKIFSRDDMLKIRLEKGEILCFSGHHLHGSNVGKKNRVNLETRIVCINDEKKFKTPKNIDSFSQLKKKKWFKNLDTNKYYS